jgi:hypothetical protein
VLDRLCLDCSIIYYQILCCDDQNTIKRNNKTLMYAKLKIRAVIIYTYIHIYISIYRELIADSVPYHPFGLPRGLKRKIYMQIIIPCTPLRSRHVGRVHTSLVAGSLTK